MMVFCRWPSLLSILFCIALAANAAATPESDLREEKTLSPYFFIENGDPAQDALPLKSTRVEVAIAGVMADVTVTQSYANSGKRPLNAKYVFPASTRAAVHGLRMSIGNRTIVAKIKERVAAEKEYEAHKKAGKNAALLEQDRPNVFSMRLANIMPGDHIDVTLQYTELLVPTAGVYEFVYPTVVGPRYANLAERSAPKTSRFVATPYLQQGKTSSSSFSLSGTLATAIPIQALESPSHGLQEIRDNPLLARFSLADGSKPSAARDFILRYGLSGGSIQSGLSLYDAGGEKFFVLVVQPPKRVPPELVPPREYVFVLDVSGSMEGFPLDIAKRALKNLVGGLRPIDTFDVLLFSGAAELIFPRPVPATPGNVNHALRAIDEQRGGGGTELLPALQQAMSLSHEAGRSRSFVVVTDGYIEADKNAIDYVRAHLGEANVFSFGIGSSVNRYLIEGLAKAGAGEPFVLTSPNQAAEATARFRDYVAAPVLTDIDVAYQGFSAYEVEPRTIPDVFADRPVIVHGKWRGGATGIVTVKGISGSGAFTQRFDVSKIAARPENRALPYLWARERIASLSDFGFGEPSPESKAAVTALGLKYSLLTQYTSFIAVSEVVRNRGTPASDVAQPLPLPDGVSNSAVGQAMTGAPEPELLLLMALVLALLAAVALHSRLGVLSR
jgi:Ca-activated chloride channel homolog